MLISRTRTDTTGPCQPSQGRVWAGAFVTFAIVFAYRWLTVSFTNDQFVHLSRGRQILTGEVPVRDFFDPGLFLKYYASAAALWASGGTLFGEALLTIVFTALGAALTYVLATRISQSSVIGAAATAAAVATFPRLYNYPKVFLFVLAVACAWRYRSRQTTAGLCLMAAVTAVAFLFRHDHGVYIGVAVTAFLILLHWPGAAGVRRLSMALGTYVGVTLVLVLPFVVFIQSVVGVPRYVTGLASQAREITTPRLNAPALRFDWTQPLVQVDPPTERRIHVRWSDDISGDVRQDAELRYDLARPIHAEGAAWTYVLTTTDHIPALLADPLVIDTHGIDRARAEVAITESLFRRAQRQLFFLRMQIAPGVLTVTNALAWLSYVTLAIPLAACLTLLGRRAKDGGTRPVGDRAIVGMLIVLCVVIGQSLVRETPETRLPDVAAPMAVLGAWVAGVWTSRGTERSRAGVAATLVFGSLTLWAAAAFGELGNRVAASGLLGGPAAIKERLDTVHEQLTAQPQVDGWHDAHSIGLRALARWVRTCTAPSDRLLVVGFAPDMYFYAERPFAGGQVTFYPDWHSSVDDQRLTVERLARQRVPIAISPVEAQPAIRQSFPIVLAYIDQHYERVVRATFESPWEYDVLVRRDIPPVGTYEPLRLPCYR